MNAPASAPQGPPSDELDALWLAFASHTSDFFGLMDEDGVALFINRSVRGAELEQVVGNKLEAFLSAERALQVRGMLSQARDSGLPVINDALRVVDRRDGSER